MCSIDKFLAVLKAEYEQKDGELPKSSITPPHPPQGQPIKHQHQSSSGMDDFLAEVRAEFYVMNEHHGSYVICVC